MACTLSRKPSSRIPASWSDTVPSRHAISNNEGDAENQQKKDLTNRGVVKPNGRTSLADPPRGAEGFEEVLKRSCPAPTPTVETP